jgi:hypothetical protein
LHGNESYSSPVVPLIIVNICSLCLHALSHHVALAALLVVFTKVPQAILAPVELRGVVEAALLLRLPGSIIAILTRQQSQKNKGCVRYLRRCESVKKYAPSTCGNALRTGCSSTCKIAAAETVGRRARCVTHLAIAIALLVSVGVLLIVIVLQ